MSHVFERGSAEIEANLTPMIDVTFLLIVFFVLVSQIVDLENVDMSLPEPIDPATQIAGEEQRAVINVLPGLGGQTMGYRLGTRTHAPSPDGLRQLQGQLTSLFNNSPGVAVNLRADRRTDYRHVQPVMEAVASAARAAATDDVPISPQINLVVVRER